MSRTEDEHVLIPLLRMGAGKPDAECPVARFMDALAGTWTTLIVRELLTGPKRFGEILSRLDGVSSKTLSARLKKLASAGILTRKDHGGVPPKVVYELTDAGMQLAPVLYEMALWADKHLPISDDS